MITTIKEMRQGILAKKSGKHRENWGEEWLRRCEYVGELFLSRERVRIHLKLFPYNSGLKVHNQSLLWIWYKNFILSHIKLCRSLKNILEKLTRPQCGEPEHVGLQEPC